MKFLVLVVLVVAVVAVNAKPTWWGGVYAPGWWGAGHGAVAPPAVVHGPAGSISVGATSAGAVIPGGWGWGGWHGAWGHHGLW